MNAVPPALDPTSNYFAWNASNHLSPTGDVANRIATPFISLSPSLVWCVQRLYKLEGDEDSKRFAIINGPMVDAHTRLYKTGPILRQLKNSAMYSKTVRYKGEKLPRTYYFLVTSANLRKRPWSTSPGQKLEEKQSALLSVAFISKHFQGSHQLLDLCYASVFLTKPTLLRKRERYLRPILSISTVASAWLLARSVSSLEYPSILIKQSLQRLSTIYYKAGPYRSKSMTKNLKGNLKNKRSAPS
jgi:hypothetical protein